MGHKYRLALTSSVISTGSWRGPEASRWPAYDPLPHQSEGVAMSKYLDRLKSRLAQKRLPVELTKPTKHHFVSFDDAQGASVPKIEPPR